MKKLGNYFLSILTIVIVLSSCNKDDDPTQNLETLETQLIGRWEAIEHSWVDSDGNRKHYTYGVNGDLEAAYTIGIDYSSGFELMPNNQLDLIWYSENKSQFFSWNIVDSNLIIDNGTLEFKIISVDESILELEFNNGNDTYKMIKLE